MNKYFLFILIITNSLFIFATDTTSVSSINQENINKHYLSISPSYQFHKYLDNQLSALLYKGNLAGIHFAFESDQSFNKYSISIGGFYGLLNGTTQQVSYQASQGLIDLKAYYLHSINYKKDQINKYLGASVNHKYFIHYNTNLQNAAFTTSFLNHIAISAELEKLFSWQAKSSKIWFLKFNRRNRNLKINFKLDLPLLFFNLRPPYSTISDFSNGENLLDLKTKTYIIGAGAFQLNTTTSLTYYLSNTNAFRISYQWQVFKFNDAFSSYQSAQHIIEFSLLFKFN